MQATELLHILKTQNKRLFIIWLVTFIAFMALLGYTIWLLNDIGTIEETTVTQENDAGYNNLIASKDLTTQIANQTAVLTNAMNSNTSAILGQMTSNVIDELRDKLAVTRDELSNTRQTATITQNVLGSLATIAPKPPCYYNCGCNPSL